MDQDPATGTAALALDPSRQTGVDLRRDRELDVLPGPRQDELIGFQRVSLARADLHASRILGEEVRQASFPRQVDDISPLAGNRDFIGQCEINGMGAVRALFALGRTAGQGLGSNDQPALVDGLLDLGVAQDHRRELWRHCDAS